MAHFYIIESLESTSVGSVITLEGTEGRHAASVSRVRHGEILSVGNGNGLIVSAEAIEIAKDCVKLEVLSIKEHEHSLPRMTLVQALAKTDRDERAIEAATELGIDTVIPWAAARSVSKWEGPKISKGVSRWSAIVREASKQSIRPFIPNVLHPMGINELIPQLADQQVIVLDPTGDTSLGEISVTHKPIALIVGPEGGITEAELNEFRGAGATIATMGSNILRTSTAGPAALAILNAKLGRC